MKGDIHPAAFRLLCGLPSRTHQQQLSPEDGRMRHCANHVRAIRVRGVLYESVTEASRQLGRSREAIRSMVARGSAEYV